MSDFKPTYLYIKRHTVTGKCYFGKTSKKDPIKYLGSGVHWSRHIKVHGIEHVETLWYKLFTDQAECTRIALLFSEQQDIVKSDLWLNQIPEDGLGGGSIKGTNLGKIHSNESRSNMSSAHIGKTHSEETKKKMSAARKGKSHSVEHIAAISKARKGNVGTKHSLETRKKMSKSKIGKPHPIRKVKCPHCNLEGSLNHWNRWHFDKCKEAKR